LHGNHPGNAHPIPLFCIAFFISRTKDFHQTSKAANLSKTYSGASAVTKLSSQERNLNIINALSESTLKGVPENRLPSPEDQLDLFMLADSNGNPGFTNTLLIWDMIPKGKAYNSVSNQASLHRKVLDIKGQKITVDIQPAQIQKIDKVTGEVTTTFHYPKDSEDVISDVIRHLCAQDYRRVSIESEFTFMYVFTINDVHKELVKRKQSFSHMQIVESLEILHKTSLTIWKPDMSDKVSSTILPVLNYKKNTKPGRKKTEDSFCQISFHVLYQVGLLKHNVRPYEMDSNIKSVLGRHIYRYVCGNFLNAGYNETTKADSVFEFDVDWIINSSIIAPGKTCAQNKVKVSRAMAELTELGHFLEPQYNDIKHQGKIEKSICKIIATPKFVKMMKASNHLHGKRVAVASQKALGVGSKK
jgi:hypothetical protein